jgi:hypothetical protein
MFRYWLTSTNIETIYKVGGKYECRTLEEAQRVVADIEAINKRRQIIGDKMYQEYFEVEEKHLQYIKYLKMATPKDNDEVLTITMPEFRSEDIWEYLGHKPIPHPLLPETPDRKWKHEEEEELRYDMLICIQIFFDTLSLTLGTYQRLEDGKYVKIKKRRSEDV